VNTDVVKVDINRPRQNQITFHNRIHFFFLKSKQLLLRLEFRIVFLSLAWFVLSRAKTEQQFFPPFLAFCIALLQFRLAGYAPRTRIPLWVGNIGIICYVFGIAISLFAGLYGGLYVEIHAEDTPVVMASAEFILLRQLIHSIFGADCFPLLYIWLGTLFIALFDWSLMLSPEEKYATKEIKKNRIRQKKKK